MLSIARILVCPSHRFSSGSSSQQISSIEGTITLRNIILFHAHLPLVKFYTILLLLLFLLLNLQWYTVAQAHPLQHKWLNIFRAPEPDRSMFSLTIIHIQIATLSILVTLLVGDRRFNASSTPLLMNGQDILCGHITPREWPARIIRTPTHGSLTPLPWLPGVVHYAFECWFNAMINADSKLPFCILQLYVLFMNR